MAGRPVTLHGGPPGLLYGLIAFVIVSVLSLGGFIFQLTKNKSAENRAQAAEDRLSRYGSPPDYFEQEARNRNSKVFAVMTDTQQELASLMTGEPKGKAGETALSAMARAQRLLAEVAARKPGSIHPQDGLLAAIERLDQLHSEAQSQAEANAATVQELQKEKASLTERVKGARDEFEAQVASLSEQLKQVQKEKMDTVEQKDTQLREMQATLDGTEAQLQTCKREGTREAREKDIEIGRLGTLIADLQKQIQALKPGSFDPNAILTSADGRILRAIPGSDVVYINLGAADRIKPGMGFEVYSPTRETSGGLRGKASLEVVTVMEETSECRVTRRVPAQPIIEGDIVVNIAYERNRQPKFVVRGDFDLNHDGVIDFNGVEEVTGIIRQWGGQVVNDLDESVDFVVVGLPPGGPGFGPEEKVSDVVRDQAIKKELDRSRFRALVERAQKMFIPVITQNQFLFLTGYAGDTVVAHH